MSPLDLEHVGVSSSGAVSLGPSVVCDGFRLDPSPVVRVQTHIHTDHMEDFETSKGYQDVLMTIETLKLLAADGSPDLPCRLGSGIDILSPDVPVVRDGVSIEILPSQHMLGAVQVAVEYSSGLRVGYSGDFSWPLERVIDVEVLILDSTYGYPRSYREITQAEVEETFVALVLSKLKEGPVHLRAHPGTLQRALQALSGSLKHPIVASSRVCRLAEVYRGFGYSIDQLLLADSDGGKAAMGSGAHLRVFGRGDPLPVSPGSATTIVLSAYMAEPSEPFLELSERSYQVPISDHADHQGTLDYVAATGAKLVITDGSRSPHAKLLADAIRSTLGVVANPALCERHREWGS